MNEDIALKHVTLPVLCLVMVVGNGWLIFVMLRYKRLRTVTNLFIMSLALSDLLMGAVVVPLLVSAEEGALGDDPRTCLRVFCITISQILVSCLVLMSIAVERYIAITMPLRHHCYVTTRNALIVIVLCWLYGILVGFLPLLGWHSPAISNHGNHTMLCRYQNVYTGGYAAFTFPGHFVPLWLLMGLLYAQIYMKTRHQGAPSCRINVRRLSSILEEDRKSHGLHRRANWRAMRILAILVGYFLFSWLPVVVWYGSLYKGFSLEDAHERVPSLPYWFYNIGVTLAYGNSAVNPVLYGLGNRSVRKACFELLTCCPKTVRAETVAYNSPWPMCSPLATPTQPLRRTEAFKQEQEHEEEHPEEEQERDTFV